MPNTQQTMKERFDEKFVCIKGDTGSGWIEGPKGVMEPFMDLDDIKQFIEKELSLERQEIALGIRRLYKYDIKQTNTDSELTIHNNSILFNSGIESSAQFVEGRGK